MMMKTSKKKKIDHLSLILPLSHIKRMKKVKVLVIQSCPTLCDSLDCSPPGSSVHGNLQARQNTGVGGRSLLQGIFSTPGSSPGLLNCRWILYCLNQTGMNLFPLFLLQVTNDLQLTPFMRKVKSSMSIHFFKCEKSRKALLESYSDRNDK